MLEHRTTGASICPYIAIRMISASCGIMCKNEAVCRGEAGILTTNEGLHYAKAQFEIGGQIFRNQLKSLRIMLLGTSMSYA